MIWLCAILFGGTLIWAFTAKIDQTVTVRGRLEPSGSVREVDSPSAGVVSKVFVKDGELVSQGQALFDVEAKGLASRRKALESTLTLFELQARTLKSILRSGGDPSRFEPLPPIPAVADPLLNAQLVTARQQSQQFRSQLEQLASRLGSRRETLRLQEKIASDLKPLYEGGGMARNQYLTQLNQVQETRAEVSTLEEERSRVIGGVAAQLNQIDRQMIQIRAELVGLKETISYRTVRAPIDGRVFDAKVSPQTVVNADQTVLKLVPANRLQAKVEISDSDIGFVKVGLPVNVSVDSFPSGEFGYIKGTLTKLGSDALPPDQRSQQYRFPATVTLKEQSVEAGDQQLNLQSGMGISANIKLRSRPVITIISDLFTKQMDGVKRFR
ncbi:hemolysin activation protein [Synechococcus sp. BS55D]|nr:hemolysin activation protein [Synechococcus sp. BS55D]